MNNLNPSWTHPAQYTDGSANLTKSQSRAQSLAVSYHAYLEALNKKAADDSHDARYDSQIAIWGFALIRAQEEVGVVLISFHLIAGEVARAEARYKEKKAAA